jgi:putative oxidoreductase
VFVSEGVQKFLCPDSLGGRFIKIGIPAASMAPFVDMVEIVGSLLLVAGCSPVSPRPRSSSTLLVALAPTKIPILLKGGFRAMAHEARTDYLMLLRSIFLILVGAGPLSVDARASLSSGRMHRARPTRRTCSHHAARGRRRRFLSERFLDLRRMAQHRHIRRANVEPSSARAASGSLFRPDAALTHK